MLSTANLYRFQGIIFRCSAPLPPFRYPNYKYLGALHLSQTHGDVPLSNVGAAPFLNAGTAAFSNSGDAAGPKINLHSYFIRSKTGPARPDSTGPKCKALSGKEK
jgi:hypothetical protein